MSNKDRKIDEMNTFNIYWASFKSQNSLTCRRDLMLNKRDLHKKKKHKKFEAVKKILAKVQNPIFFVQIFCTIPHKIIEMWGKK